MALHNKNMNELFAIRERYEYDDVLNLETGLKSWITICDEFFLNCSECPIEPLCNYTNRILSKYYPCILKIEDYDSVEGCFESQDKTNKRVLGDYDLV